MMKFWKTLTCLPLVVALVFSVSLAKAQDTNTGGTATLAGGLVPSGTAGDARLATVFDLSPGAGAPPPTLGGFAMIPALDPTVLLVDDDDNGPDVRSYYTAALDALGMGYDIWDTGNSDNEPDASYLANYDTVIWFTGVEFGGAAAGPGSAGESALGTFLDQGGCLFISSQDYSWARGLTGFMSGYLGVSAASDVGQTSVTGTGIHFSGLGPYSLSYPFTNYSDVVSSDGTAETAFVGDRGDAAVAKDSGTYRTTFWGFPFEAIATASDRQAAMSRVLQYCSGAAVCDIQMSQPTYTAGDTVTATVYRFANRGPAPVPVEAKAWIGIPSGPPISALNVGADGSISLPAGFDQDFGPLPLFTAATAGSYEFSCRLRNPVTGALLAEDLNPFAIQ